MSPKSRRMFLKSWWMGVYCFVVFTAQRRRKKPPIYLTLRPVWSLYNPQNSEMKFCENMKLTC